MSNLNFITFTNKGYVDYTNNLLQSIKVNNLNLSIKVYALDDFSFKYFNTFHKNTELYLRDEFANTYFNQADEKFGNLMLVKFELIYKELLVNNNVVYVDGDIVFKRDFTEYIFNFSPSSDIVFQNDLNPSKPNREWVCAGFMYIKSNKRTIKFFRPTKKLVKKFTSYNTHDQSYINDKRNKFKYSILPLDDFPNGAHFYSNFKNLTPYLIHFNYVRGDEKIELMNKHSEWYLK